MMNQNKIRILLAMTSIGISMHASASLYDRGNGMIYDSDQNITWLQDANFAKTSGYDADGKMIWPDASNWAFRLTYGGYNDWRLATAFDGSDYFRNFFKYDGSSTVGYNSTESELGHLFFELGNTPKCDTSGNCSQSSYGLSNTSFIDASTGSMKSFINVQIDRYWEDNMQCDGNCSYFFDMSSGLQDYIPYQNGYYAWAVRQGDVAPTVPLPTGGLLFVSAFLGVAINKLKLSRRYFS